MEERWKKDARFEPVITDLDALVPKDDDDDDAGIYGQNSETLTLQGFSGYRKITELLDFEGVCPLAGSFFVGAALSARFWVTTLHRSLAPTIIAPESTTWR